MLNDVARNRAYYTAIMDAEQYINGKVYNIIIIMGIFPPIRLEYIVRCI